MCADRPVEGAVNCQGRADEAHLQLIHNYGAYLRHWGQATSVGSSCAVGIVCRDITCHYYLCLWMFVLLCFENCGLFCADFDCGFLHPL